MSFRNHEQCPRCAELGNDRRGNNLARYTDGSAFCFSCHYVERATSFGYVAVRRDGEVPKDLIPDLPAANREWLGQYLSDEEVSTHFAYSPSLKRHVFTSGKYWEARSVLGAQPKTVSHGDKPYIMFGEGGPHVFVEDVVSAIKAGRCCTATPLFGNSIPPDWIVRTVKQHPGRVGIWLDQDMVGQSRKLVKKFNLLRPDLAFSIETELDPKAYSTEEIRRFIND